MFGGRWNRFLPGVLAVLLLVVAPSCANKPVAPGPKVELTKGQRISTAIFYIDVKGKTQTLYPDAGYIWIGDGAGDPREVWWIFSHKSAVIKVAPKKNPSNVITIDKCEDLGKAKVCKWSIPKNSLDADFYKFTISGKNDGDQNVDPIDPDLEVDK